MYTAKSLHKKRNAKVPLIIVRPYAIVGIILPWARPTRRFTWSLNMSRQSSFYSLSLSLCLPRMFGWSRKWYLDATISSCVLVAGEVWSVESLGRWRVYLLRWQRLYLRIIDSIERTDYVVDFFCKNADFFSIVVVPRPTEIIWLSFFRDYFQCK